ncbi:MAG: cell wall hydrolase [Clostridia bacterium]|nr:cell wall hydrolase [Clostridia bacterium]
MSLLALIIGAVMESTGSIGEAIGSAEDDFYLLARCVEAEAGNQDQTGKRLVAAVILNRVESSAWPDTIEGVITQERQFEVYPNSMNKAPSEETVEACLMELEERTDEEIIYFASSGYIGAPAYKHGNHYFGY